MAFWLLVCAWGQFLSSSEAELSVDRLLIEKVVQDRLLEAADDEEATGKEDNITAVADGLSDVAAVVGVDLGEEVGWYVTTAFVFADAGISVAGAYIMLFNGGELKNTLLAFSAMTASGFSGLKVRFETEDLTPPLVVDVLKFLLATITVSVFTIGNEAAGQRLQSANIFNSVSGFAVPMVRSGVLSLLGCSALDPSIRSEMWPDGTPTCPSENTESVANWLLRGFGWSIVLFGVYIAPVIAFALSIFNGSTLGANLMVGAVSNVIVMLCAKEYLEGYLPQGYDQADVKFYLDMIAGPLFVIITIYAIKKQFQKIKNKMRRAMVTDDNKWQKVLLDPVLANGELQQDLKVQSGSKVAISLGNPKNMRSIRIDIDEQALYAFSVQLPEDPSASVVALPVKRGKALWIALLLLAFPLVYGFFAVYVGYELDTDAWYKWVEKLLSDRVTFWVVVVVAIMLIILLVWLVLRVLKKVIAFLVDQLPGEDLPGEGEEELGRSEFHVEADQQVGLKITFNLESNELVITQHDGDEQIRATLPDPGVSTDDEPSFAVVKRQLTEDKLRQLKKKAQKFKTLRTLVDEPRNDDDHTAWKGVCDLEEREAWAFAAVYVRSQDEATWAVEPEDPPKEARCACCSRALTKAIDAITFLNNFIGVAVRKPHKLKAMVKERIAKLEAEVTGTLSMTVNAAKLNSVLPSDD
jgi:hypothetical protein